MTAIEIIILVVAGLALALHFLPKQTNPAIAKAQADVDGVYDWLVAHLEHKAAVVTSVVAPALVAPKAAAVPAVAAPAPIPTVNGVPVPKDLSYESFNALVLATAGAASLLPIIDPTAAWFTPTWFHAFGPYFREELLAQATGAKLLALQTLAPGGPALMYITPEQQAAANASAGVAAASIPTAQ